VLGLGLVSPAPGWRLLLNHLVTFGFASWPAPRACPFVPFTRGGFGIFFAFRAYCLPLPALTTFYAFCRETGYCGGASVAAYCATPTACLPATAHHATPVFCSYTTWDVWILRWDTSKLPHFCVHLQHASPYGLLWYADRLAANADGFCSACHALFAVLRRAC